MPLKTGTQLGPYRILAPLGAGGMGEVYRAHDTRLGRDVAIKVLSPHLAATPELRARFEREARTISQLNHPHICTLHDIGHQDDTDYLVMELLEGETLAHRLEKGPLPLAEVLTLGTQIADALDRAHRAGVIHRDLKPGNIMLTKSGAKLMDFGLARVSGLAPASGALADSPTLTRALTAEGTLVGTFQYMAPEQLEGREADARTDIWALGCLLYEMATGKRAFEGTSQASLIAAIMDHEPPPIMEQQPLTPPALEHVVKRCLAKDPSDRWQSARDVMHELRWIAAAGSQAGSPVPVSVRRRQRERSMWMLVTTTLVVVAACLGWIALRSRTGDPSAIYASVDGPSGALLPQTRGDIAISPDGRMIAFSAVDSTGRWICVRPLGSDVATRISHTHDGGLPFWSPDSRYLAYFAEGKLEKVAVTGGKPTTICEAMSGRGGSWSRDGVIVFAPTSEGPLMRVASGGGEVVPITELDSTRHETGHRLPCFLPDGEHFLFAAMTAGSAGYDIYVGSLRRKTAKRILVSDSAPVYAEPGYLLFERDRRVMAQRFHAGRLEPEGDAVAIADAPPPSPDLAADPVASASRNGRLVMLRNAPPETRLVMLDRTGATCTRYNLPPGPWRTVRVSPDGTRAAVSKYRDLWIVDLIRSVPMQFATSVSQDEAVWSPRGDRIAFVSGYAGRDEIHVAGLDGKAEPVPTTEDAIKFVNDWSQDGRYVVFTGVGASTGFDLWLLPIDGDRKPVPYLQGRSWETGARVSPDGRWLAYVSDEEVYVQSFPQPGRKVRVSSDGGGAAVWSKGGRELIYLRGLTVMSVPVEAGEELRLGPSRPLFTLPMGVLGGDVVADGDRFLVTFSTGTRPADLCLVLNWQALLRR